MTKSFNPKVSILIPVYNGSDYVRQAIDSTLAQTYKNIEIIVVNDGSTDGGKTDKICKSYGEKIRYFLKENGGVASALNYGISKMEGEYLSWLSHDDIYYPDKVEKQIRFLKSLKNKDTVLYSNVEYIDENGITFAKTDYEKRFPIKKLNTRLFPALKGFMNGCAIMIPKVCFDKVGLFNENLKTTNDYDMWFRICRGCEVMFIPETLIKYRIHKNQGTQTNPFYIKESEELWSSIIRSLTLEEISKFEKDTFKFYYEIANQMKASGYVQAYKIAFGIAEKYYKQKDPKVSVIMPCYNTAKFLKDAVESILNQTYGDFELIIVDDSSTDNSWKILERYQKRDFRVIVTKNKFKKGISGAMNTGIGLAKGEYITRMDSDDISLPERLNRQVSFLDKNKKYGLCSVNLETFGDVTRASLFQETNVPLEWLFFWRNPIANAPAMYRKNIIKDNKILFNEYETAEDYDFLCKVILHTRPYYIDEVLYRYRIHAKSVFQRTKNQGISNSIKTSRDLAKKILGNEPPGFYDELTDFKEIKSMDKKANEIQIFKEMEKLVKRAKEYWSWTNTEYAYAIEESKKRIYRYLAYDELESQMKEIKALQSEHNNNIDTIRILESKNNELLLEVNRKIYKLVIPIKKVGELLYMVRTQGMLHTIENLFNKIRKERK